ncbi:hypothetical protein BAE44_0023102 [Dichanthelium oligosanthes]|uniref:Thaumatin-like protein n=1 Tax=Dichanthelium oligosanthes TaxID=888268 RepID=A0A1E5USJ8_9POAL|nr:hypothetical protein BAE44_0023102 [Dichanthelium oligosanthes]
MRCVVDLNATCPPEQQVKASGGRVVACKAGNSESLKKACPKAAASGGFSCAIIDNTYTVTFCPDSSELGPRY